MLDKQLVEIGVVSVNKDTTLLLFHNLLTNMQFSVIEVLNCE